jgi:hypothetical protein
VLGFADPNGGVSITVAATLTQVVATGLLLKLGNRADPGAPRSGPLLRADTATSHQRLIVNEGLVLHASARRRRRSRQ